MQKRIELSVIALIAVLYLVAAWGYATRTPDWQVPDEPAHYNYIRQIVEDGAIPVIESGDWNQPYIDELRATQFAPAVVDDPITPEVEIHSVEYEDHQPPLYYLLQASVYRLNDGDIEPLRLFSAIIGFGAVIATWLIGRRLFPLQPWIGVTAAGLMAFIPQRLAMMAGVNNDSLAETLTAFILLLVVIYLTTDALDWRLPLTMGVMVGLVFLTKSTVYYISGVAGLAILLRWWQKRWSWRQGMQQVLLFAVPALLLGLIWWVHSIDVYGGLDFLGLERHDDVVVGQPRTDDYIENVYGGSQRVYLENMIETTYHSFWGQFGWMAVPMTTNVYRLLLIGSLVGLVGLVFWYPWRGLRENWPVAALFGLSIVLVVIQFLLYNRTFVQFQGRYLYPALVPLVLVLAVGFSGWTKLLTSRIRQAGWLAIVPVLVLFGLAWYALNTYLVPNL